MEELKGKKIVMLAGEGFEDTELMYPLYRLRYECGADVRVAGLNRGMTLKGKRATGWKSLAVDIEDAGAKYVDEPLVADGQYLFSRQPTDLGFFCDAVIRSLKGKRLPAEAAPAL